MQELDDNLAPPARPPRTSTVLVLLAAFAMAVSYLAIYAGTGVLIQADLMSPLPAGSDPRPRWLLYTFAGLFGSAALLALVVSGLGRRQLRGLDTEEEVRE